MRLRVATLNVWALPWPISQKPVERVEAIGRRLESLDLDVIAFQEAWMPWARSLLVEAGRAAGMTHSWHREAAFGCSGLLVLSRLPILETLFEPFVVRGFPQGIDHLDYYGRKGLVRVRLETPGGPISLMNTHLQARYEGDVEHHYLAHRTAQVVQLASAARALSEPLLLLGDFNFVEGQLEYRILTGLTGLDDVAAALDQREPTVFADNPYRRRDKPGQRKDLIFARAGGARHWLPFASERVFDETFEIDGEQASYSNHAGVLVEIELEAGGAPQRAADVDAIGLARTVLAEGREDASSRRRGGWMWAGSGLGCATIAAVGEHRLPPLRRRGFLRTSLQLGVFSVLSTSVAMPTLSELFVRHEIDGFDRQLARLEALRAPSRSGSRSRQR